MLVLPLAALVGAQSLVAALLCIPWKPLTRVGLLATGVLRQSAAQIIVGTLAAVLATVLAFAALRIYQLQDVLVRPVADSGGVSVFHEARLELYAEGVQAVLIGASLLLGMTILRLDALLRANKSLQMNLETMTKQAKGAQAAYMQQLEKSTSTLREDEKGAMGAASSAKNGEDAATMHLKKQISVLQEELEHKQKDLRAADASVAAIKKQTEGLQLEFNRLLEENENLRAQLSIFDRKYAAGDEKKRM